MRYKPNETMEEWSQRVLFFEYGIALTRMATKEENIQVILDEMGKNITNKLTHPILNLLKESANLNVEEELKQSRIRYKEQYLDRFGPKADHLK